MSRRASERPWKWSSAADASFGGGAERILGRLGVAPKVTLATSDPGEPRSPTRRTFLKRDGRWRGLDTVDAVRLRMPAASHREKQV